jgi:deoxyribodipyrimidine photo-lyase
MKQKVVIYWARRDLRCADNPALSRAVAYAKKESVPLLPLFILEDYMVTGDPQEQFGYPSRFFLTRALPRFAEQFSSFTVVQGKVVHTMRSLAQYLNITIFVNEDVHADFYAHVSKIEALGIPITVCADALTVSKETKTGSGNMYSVFTPFKNAVWKSFCTAPVLPRVRLQHVPLYTKKISTYCKTIACTEANLTKVFSTTNRCRVGGVTYDIDSLHPEPRMYREWYVDEAGALKQFNHFLKHSLVAYKKDRDSLALDGTSRMSLALAWGLVSARTLRARIQKHCDHELILPSTNPRLEGAVHYISELIWREFYKYLLYHNPTLMDMEFQEKYRGTVKWVDDKTAHYRFKQWMQGTTGYPIVDAAMMELARTGYMHNRARMIVASVLTKHFGVDWRWGQEYFRAMLIDLDEASNNGGWQWGASVGADPKPIRIFNPYLQAEHYDADKKYQNKFLSDAYRAHPPVVVIEHKEARAAALRRYGLSDHHRTREG